jgi:hypothetical protein
MWNRPVFSSKSCFYLPTRGQNDDSVFEKPAMCAARGLENQSMKTCVCSEYREIWPKGNEKNGRVVNPSFSGILQKFLLTFLSWSFQYKSAHWSLSSRLDRLVEIKWMHIKSLGHLSLPQWKSPPTTSRRPWSMERVLGGQGSNLAFASC